MSNKLSNQIEIYNEKMGNCYDDSIYSRHLLHGQK